MGDNPTKCPHCGAQMKIWKHTLTPRLVSLLAKFARGVKRSGKNDVHIQREISLTRSEDANFQKLRYFGLVAKVRDKSGRHIGGHWLLTRRGGGFLRGEVAVPSYIKTWRNSIFERSEDLVTIHSIRLPEGCPSSEFQKEFDFEIMGGLVEEEDI